MRSLLGLAALSTTLCAVLPAEAAEPGLEGRDDIVLQDQFEGVSWYQAWGQSKAPQNTSIVSDGSSFRGQSHLRVTVPKGSHYGTSFGFNFDKQGIAEPDEVYFRYAIRLGPTWTTDGGGGGKLPGFGGTYGVAGWGGKPANGSNGWSSRGLFSKPPANPQSGQTRTGFYVYHADMTGQYGSNWYWSGGSLGPDGVMQREQWYQFEVYVKINTPQQNDGVLKAWADGTQVYEKTDVRFRDVDTLKVERVWFDIYYGGSWTAPADMYIDFDNAVIAQRCPAHIEVLAHALAHGIGDLGEFPRGAGSRCPIRRGRPCRCRRAEWRPKASSRPRSHAFRSLRPGQPAWSQRPNRWMRMEQVAHRVPIAPGRSRRAEQWTGRAIDRGPERFALCWSNTVIE